MDKLVKDYMKAHKKQPVSSRLALAYTRADVADLNDAIRDEMKKRGQLSAEQTPVITRMKDGDHHIESVQHFTAGDRILFRENNPALGVMNGSFGTLAFITENGMTVKLDNGKTVTFSPQEYNAIQHGYAATVHKSQGITVDECFVLASPLFDKHTAYVAMTRHKYDVKMYAAKNDFRGKNDLFTALSKDSDRLSTLAIARRQEREINLALQKPTWAQKIKDVFQRASGKQATQPVQTPQPQRQPSRQPQTEPSPSHSFNLEAQRQEAMKRAVLPKKRQSHERDRDYPGGPSMER